MFCHQHYCGCVYVLANVDCHNSGKVLGHVEWCKIHFFVCYTCAIHYLVVYLGPLSLDVVRTHHLAIAQQVARLFFESCTFVTM